MTRSPSVCSVRVPVGDYPDSGPHALRQTPVPAPARPLFCINTAPAALCLAAYLTCMDSVSTGLVSTLAALVTALYILVLIRLPKYLSESFFPSWAAFTFPFVITAVSLKMAAVFLTKAGFGAGWQGTVVLIVTIIAAWACRLYARSFHHVRSDRSEISQFGPSA